MPDLTSLEPIIRAGLDRVFPAAQVVVRQGGRTLFSGAYGFLDPETRQRPTRPDTLFDLASVTKLFVVTAFMTLVEAGKVAVDQPVCAVLPEFSGVRPIQPYEDPLKPGAFVSVTPDLRGLGVATATPDLRGLRDLEGLNVTTVDASRITFRHLLAHNSGLPAWRPLFREGSPAAARRLALTTHFSYPTGARVVYSDIGLILLGMAVEALTGLCLDEAVRVRVTEPLRVLGIGYCVVDDGSSAQPEQSPIPNPQSPISNTEYPIPNLNIAPTEICAWRGRRMVGQVHDENAYGLGGVAGHAGLFANATDLATFGQSFLDALQIANRKSQIANPQSLLHPATIAEMTHLQSQDGATRRGLGFALWSPDPEASSNPFSPTAFGHTGFTGTSLWLDPERDLVVACLTNRVYYGRDAGGILEFRVALHRAVVEGLGTGD